MANTAGSPAQGTAGGSIRSKPKRRETRDVIRISVAVVALVLLIAFVLDNSQTVKVGFVFFNTQLSLIWVLLIAAVLGALVDRLVIFRRARTRKKAAKASR